MQSRFLSDDEVRKFQVRSGSPGPRMDRYWQNVGACSGCRNDVSIAEILPQTEHTPTEAEMVQGRKTA